MGWDSLGHLGDVERTENQLVSHKTKFANGDPCEKNRSREKSVPF